MQTAQIMSNIHPGGLQPVWVVGRRHTHHLLQLFTVQQLRGLQGRGWRVDRYKLACTRFPPHDHGLHCSARVARCTKLQIEFSLRRRG